jgi:hypothetical protein
VKVKRNLNSPLSPRDRVVLDAEILGPGRLNYRGEEIWVAGLVACRCDVLQRAVARSPGDMVGAYASYYGVGLRDTDTDTPTLWLRAARGLDARSVWT